jgi:quinohemoprotein ethanol dehydrogenase
MKIRLVGMGLWLALLSPTWAAAADKPADSEWRLLGGNPDAWHFSELDQINTRNVGSLGLAWYADMPTRDGMVGNALVADGVVYQSGPQSRVFANDVKTGKLLWQYVPKLNMERDFVGLWTMWVNRGLALWEDKLFVGTGDCRVLALDRGTGKLLWEALSCDPATSAGITGAPRVGGGMVFIGNACGDTGLQRGFVDAFDMRTGARRWRFYTVPSSNPAENDTEIMKKAATTWGTDWGSRTKGCGSAWDGLTYDRVLDQLYIGVAGPAPWNPADRAPDMGDELFSTAIVAVDAKTGAYRWHYTTTPKDAWNFDATMPIMLADLKIDGKKRRVVMQAPKNGFFYVLDAKTGKLLRANNIAKVNWASHIDMKTGRPVEIPGARDYYLKPGTPIVVWPGPGAAHNWYPMSYNPGTGLVYVPIMETPTFMQVIPADVAGGAQGVGGNLYYDLIYGAHEPAYRDKMYGELVAWDPVANKARWRTRQQFLVNGGTLATAGNLVFQGTTDGKFRAYDAVSGRELWSWQGQGSIQAGATAVLVGGEQVILVAAGNAQGGALTPYVSATSVASSRGPSRLLAFKLGGTAKLPDPLPEIPFNRPSRPKPAADLAKRGALLYFANSCDLCHGADAIGTGGSIPDLRRLSEASHRAIKDTVQGGVRRPLGMPQFATMTDDTLEAIQAYLINQAWEAYEKQEQAAGKAD